MASIPDDFDFWIGEWELASHSRVDYDSDEWRDGPASNRVTRILDGHVLLEEFDGRPTEELRGLSVTAWDAAAGLWRQTWVDNQGSYLDLVGGREGNTRVLSRQATVKERPAIQRMVFDEIETSSFRWRWEVSWDRGASWLLLWEIGYRRRA